MGTCQHPGCKSNAMMTVDGKHYCRYHGKLALAAKAKAASIAAAAPPSVLDSPPSVKPPRAKKARNAIKSTLTGEK